MAGKFPEKWLDAIGARVSLPKGKVIIKTDEVPEYCYYISNGSVMSYEYTPSGGKYIHRFEEKGTLILEANLFLQKPTSISYSTATPADLIKISLQEMEEAIRTQPQTARHMISALSQKCLDYTNQIYETTRHNATWRVCNLFISLSGLYGAVPDESPLIREKLSQQTMANLLGINRVTLVRIIKELRHLGLLEQIDGVYRIVSTQRFREYMEHCE